MPVLRRSGSTVVAINVGGALLPAGLSVYPVVHNGVWWQVAAGVLVVAAIVYRVAQPVNGLGIGVPALLPPLLAAAVARPVTSAGTAATAAVAYAAGSLGTLIGADLLHLRDVREVGASVACIGGAGTCDAPVDGPSSGRPGPPRGRRSLLGERPRRG